jgi:hypothetical protein
MNELEKQVNLFISQQSLMMLEIGEMAKTTYKNKLKKNGQHKSGNLESSFKVDNIKKESVDIRNTAEYASFVNDKKEFMGESPTVNAKIKQIINNKIKTIFK